jgi:taurine dioxygenase
VVHNRGHLIQKYNRAALSPEELAKMQDVIHPVVVESAVDGRKSFFITNGSTKSVQGMSQEDGWALIKELIAYTVQEQFVYRHKWRDKDVLICIRRRLMTRPNTSALSIAPGCVRSMW